MNRREFITHSAAALGYGTALFSGCHKTSSDFSVSEEKDGKMTMRTNPNTGDQVSLLGYGMMRLPVLNTGVESREARIDQETVNELVDYAIAHGVNYYDTSPVYCQGQSEEATGIALSRYPRHSYFIATKMSNFWPDLWSREESQAMFERSLHLLRTDYIDYLLLHNVGRGGMGFSGKEAFFGRYMNNGILDWLVEQKRIGRIRNLGFSYHGDIEVFNLLLQWHDAGRYHWDFAQIELNYLDWNYANEINDSNTDASYLYGELEKRGIPAVVMEPLLGGRLAKLPPSIVQEMKHKDLSSTPAKWAFRYAGSPKGILTVLSGMTYIEHLRENCITYSPLSPISEEEDRFLMQIAGKLYDIQEVPCTGCNYCMPCPYGINIPAVFGYYNQCLKEDIFPSTDGAQKDSEFRKARKRWLIGYDRKISHMRQADHCIGCNQCVPQCPQHINIPQEMSKIDQYAEQLRQSL